MKKVKRTNTSLSEAVQYVPGTGTVSDLYVPVPVAVSCPVSSSADSVTVKTNWSSWEVTMQTARDSCSHIRAFYILLKMDGGTVNYLAENCLNMMLLNSVKKGPTGIKN